MTSDRRFERDLPDLLAELAPRATPDYRDDIVRQTAHMRQRPAWMFPERWLRVSVITFRAFAAPPIRWRIVGLVALLLLALAVGLVVVAGSQRHLPAPFGPAANGLVAYSKDGDIFTVDPATGTRRAIVTGAATDQGPAFSLDGTRLAFTRTTGTGPVLVVADADGGNLVAIPMTQLGNVPVDNVYRPSWSPDGRSIAVTTDDNGDTGSLWIVDTVDRTIRKIDVVTDDIATQWRPPDGRQLMVTARVSDRVQFALVSAVDGSVTILPTGPVGDADGGLRAGGWSLEGGRFAYAGPDAQVHVLGMESGADLVISPSLAQDTGGFPRFSNDGRHILFMEWSTGEPSWLSVAPSDGSKPAIRVSDEYQVAIGTHYYWSPDDTSIVLEPQFGGSRVLLDPAGGPPSTPPWMTEEIESWQRLAR